MKRIGLTIGALAAVVAAACLTLAVKAQQHSDSPGTPDQVVHAAVEKSSSAMWLTNFSSAQKQAKAGRKFILLDFTGSDWCPWCMRLDSEILTTPEFREFASKYLVLMKVDFPLHHPQSAAEQTQNEQLATQFQVQDYPTLVMLNPDGQELGTLGYMSGGPKPFIDKLTAMITD